jgi:hypothetical protein
MPIKDKSMTVLGATAIVVSVELAPQQDGSTSAIILGAAQDSIGGTQPLTARVTIPVGTNIVDNLLALALSQLRKANGLE